MGGDGEEDREAEEEEIEKRERQRRRRRLEEMGEELQDAKRKGEEEESAHGTQDEERRRRRRSRFGFIGILATPDGKNVFRSEKSLSVKKEDGERQGGVHTPSQMEIEDLGREAAEEIRQLAGDAVLHAIKDQVTHGWKNLKNNRRVEHTILAEGEWRDDGKERDRVAIGPPEGEESSTEASREDSQSSPSPPQMGSLSVDCSSSSSIRLVKPSSSSSHHPLQSSCSSSSASAPITLLTTASSRPECGLCGIVHTCELCRSSLEHFLTVDHRFLNVLEALDGESEEERSQILQQKVSQNRLDTPVVSIELGEVVGPFLPHVKLNTVKCPGGGSSSSSSSSSRRDLRREGNSSSSSRCGGAGGGSGHQGGVWMHVRCLMSMTQLDVDCHARGFTNLKTLLEESLQRRCGFCGLKGATVQCVSCPRFFHYPCSLKAYYSSGVLSHTKTVENMRRDGGGHGELHNGGCLLEEEGKAINEDDEKKKTSLKTSKLSALAAAQKLSPYQRTRCLPDSLYFGRYLCFSCRKARHEADVLIPYLTGEVFLSAQTRAWLSSSHRCILSGACLFGKVLPYQGGRSKSSNSLTKYQDSPQQPLPPVGAYCHRETVTAACTIETGVNRLQLTPSDGGGGTQTDTAKFVETGDNAKSLFSDEEMVENEYKVSVEAVRRGEETSQEKEERLLESCEEIQSRNKDTGNVREENEGENTGLTSDRAVSSNGRLGEESRRKETERSCVKEGRMIEYDAVALFQRAFPVLLNGEVDEKKEMRHENIRRLSTLLLSCSYEDKGRHPPHGPPCCFTSVGVYVPQLGDLLRYFPQLHQNPVLPHDRIQVWQPELFLPCDVFVEGLSFEFPGLPVDEELPMITAVLTLQVLRPIALRGRRFQVHFSPSCDGGADYLVPLLDVNRGLLRLLQFKEGEGCRAYMDGRFYTGYVSCVARGPPSLLEALRSDRMEKSSSSMSSSSSAVSCSSSSSSSTAAASLRGLSSTAHPSMLAGAAALSRAEAMKKQQRQDTDRTVKSEEGEKERNTANSTQRGDGNAREVSRPLAREEVHRHSAVDTLRMLPKRVDAGSEEGKRAETSATASSSCSSSHGFPSHLEETHLPPLHASDEAVNTHTGNVSLSSALERETGAYEQQEGRVPAIDKDDNNRRVALCDSEREEEREKFALNAAIALGKWPSFSTPGVVNCGKLLAKIRRELNTKTSLKSMNEKEKKNKDQRSPGDSSDPERSASCSSIRKTHREGMSRSLFDDDHEEKETQKEETPLDGRKCMLNQWERREEEILAWLARASLGLEAIQGGGGRGRGRHGNSRGRSSSSSHQQGQGSGQHKPQPPSSSSGSSGEVEVPGGGGEEDPRHEEQWLNAWEVDFRKGERERQHSRLQRWLQEIEFPRSRQLELFAALDKVMTLTEVLPSHAEEEEEDTATTITTTLGGGISDDHQHTKALRRSSRRRATPSLGFGPSNDDREQGHLVKGEKEGGDRRTRRQQKMTMLKGEQQDEESIVRRRTGGDTRRGGGGEEGDSTMSVRVQPAASCTPSSSETISTPPLFEAFIDPVPLIGNSRSARRSAPLWLQEYWKEIALPISLSLIRERLWYGYYRREAALHADFRLLLADCRQFNPPGDFLHTLSYQLEQELLRRGLFLKKDSKEEESLLCVHAETQLALAEVLEDMMSQQAVMWACGRARKNKKPVEEEGEGEKGEQVATHHKQTLPGEEERQALMRSSISGDTMKEKDKGKESVKPTEEKKLPLATEPQMNYKGDEDRRYCEATQVEGLSETSSNLPASSSVNATKGASSSPSYQFKEERTGRADDTLEKMLFEATEDMNAIVPSLSSMENSRPSPGKGVSPTTTAPEVTIPGTSSRLSSSQGGSLKEEEAYSASHLCPLSLSSSSFMPSFSQTTAAAESIDKAGLPVREEVSQGVSLFEAVSSTSPQKRPMPTGGEDADDDHDHLFVSPSCTSLEVSVRKTKRRRLRVIAENEDDATAMTQHGTTEVGARAPVGRRTRRGVRGSEQEDQRQEGSGEGGDELEKRPGVSGSPQHVNQGGTGGDEALSMSRRGRIIKKPSVSYPHSGESGLRKGEQEVEGRRSNQTAIMGVGRRRRRLRSSGVLQGNSPDTGRRGSVFGEGSSWGDGMSATGGEGEVNEDLDEDMVLKQVLALSVKTYEEERARNMGRQDGEATEPVSEKGKCSTSSGKGRKGDAQEGMDENVPERDLMEAEREKSTSGPIHHRGSEGSSGGEVEANDAVSRMRGGARRDGYTHDALGKPFRQPGVEKEEERRANNHEVADGALEGHAALAPHIRTPEQGPPQGEEKSSGVAQEVDQEESVESASGEGKDNEASQQQQQEHVGSHGVLPLTTERPRKRGRPKGSVRRTVIPQMAKEEEEHQDEEEEDVSDADEDSDEDYEEEDDTVKRRTTKRTRGRRGRGRRGRAGRPPKVAADLSSSSGDDTPRRCSGRLSARPGLRDLGLRRSARHHQGGGGGDT
ncbi:wd g-beta repeat-containing protein [Cystoisospora suis]|uniref:Wd g-beta repeat-containing protein n=1 Tax=Cystoisospora suis TaxID=483139 RepID=A0A2C6LFI6_9APIC|nr:wd g-beta repeat-containing protein [Cystoisospora suis]